MSQSIESRIKERNKREATRAWAASISAERKKRNEAEARLNRAYEAAHKALGLGTLKGHPTTLSPETATILAALITIYKE